MKNWGGFYPCKAGPGDCTSTVYNCHWFVIGLHVKTSFAIAIEYKIVPYRARQK